MYVGFKNGDGSSKREDARFWSVIHITREAAESTPVAGMEATMPEMNHRVSPPGLHVASMYSRQVQYQGIPQKPETDMKPNSD